MLTFQEVIKMVEKEDPDKSVRMADLSAILIEIDRRFERLERNSPVQDNHGKAEEWHH